MVEVKELTKEQIEEAIEKKWCPYCEDECHSFSGTVGAWQEFWFDDEGKLQWDDLEGDDELRGVFCKNCGEKIPEEIWKKWFK